MLDDVRKPELERVELIVEPIKNVKGFYTGYLHKGELVRCKDCKHHEYDWCYLNDNNFLDDDFCSYGEREGE